MNASLRILLLEDNLADVALIAHELEVDGFVFSLKWVQTETEFRDELMSDNGRPAFDGFRALAITRAARPQLPFIFISGSNDQGMVVEMYEQGATDYVFKRDIGDLKSAVQGALDAAPAEPSLVPNPPPRDWPLPLPKAVPPPPHFTSVIGHLFFCPQCRWARDETGRIVLLQDYCGHRSEIIIVRQVCTECREPSWWR